MAVRLSNGSLVHIGSAYAAAKTVTAISNASEAVVTCAAHGLTTGDYIVLTSGWTRLNERTFRVTSVTSGSFKLDGIDTTDVNIYASGSGIGEFKKVTTWTQVQQILEITSSGGEQQFVDYQFLEADAAVRIPTFKSPVQMTFSIADDPTLTGYQALKTANDDRDPRAFRVTLANGGKLAGNAYLSLSPTPSLTVNEVMAVQATATLTNPELSRYAS